MAILITGGAGYIGSHMVHELADRGEQPVVIDDFSSGFDGRGYSVLQVIEAMRQESGNDFPVEFVVRRPGDPAEIVASAERMRNLLGWRPQWDDLSLIVRHALTWERKLLAQGNARLPSRVFQLSHSVPLLAG
jgi:UDP-glucose 4-epimerase